MTMREQFQKYLACTLCAFPAVLLFCGDVALCFGEKNLPYDDAMIAVSFFVAMAAVTAYLAKVPPSPETMGRACLCFAASGFGLAVAGVVFYATEPPSENPIFTRGIVMVAAILAGSVLGIIGLALRSAILKPSSGERH